ncbi:MAG: hypothetical protein AB1552_03790 [Nitrospirota bacterium]
MSRDNMKKIVSILMGSPFYLTLSIEERYHLVQRLLRDYKMHLRAEDSQADIR